MNRARLLSRLTPSLKSRVAVAARCCRLCSCRAPLPSAVVPASLQPLLESAAVDASSVRRLSASDLCASLLRLQAESYALLSHLPWLQLSNVNLAFIQLVKNGLLQQLMSPIVGHPGFRTLETDLRRRLPALSNAELFQTFVALQRLGVDRASPLLSGAFVEALRRLRGAASSDESLANRRGQQQHPPPTLGELRELCYALQDYGPVPTVVPHLCHLLRRAVATAPPANPDTALMIADLILLVHKTLPSTAVQALVRAFAEAINNCPGDPVPTPAHARAYTRMAAKMAVTVAERWSVVAFAHPAAAATEVSIEGSSQDDCYGLGRALVKCLPSLAARARKLDAADLSAVAFGLRKWSLYSGDVQAEVHGRALLLLGFGSGSSECMTGSIAGAPDPNCADTISLADVLFGNVGNPAQPAVATPPQQSAVRRRVAQLLIRLLPDADALLKLRLIGTLAQPGAMRQIGSEVGLALRATLVSDFNLLFSMPGRLTSLLNFAAAADLQLPRDDAWTAAFARRLFELLDRTQYGASTFAVCEIGGYLLPVCAYRRTVVPGDEFGQAALHRLASKLSSFVPQLRLTSAARLTRAVNRALCAPSLPRRQQSQQRPVQSSGPYSDEPLHRLNMLLFENALRDLRGLAARGGFPLLNYVARHVLTKNFSREMRLLQEKLAMQLMSQFHELIPHLADSALLQVLQLYRQVRYYDGNALTQIERRLYTTVAAATIAAGPSAARTAIEPEASQVQPEASQVQPEASQEHTWLPQAVPMWVQLLLSALRLFALVGYTPSEVTQFMATCSSVPLGRLRTSDLLTFAYDLACIGCFPRELLQSLLSIQFLSQFEDELRRLPADVQTSYLRQLMCLNRAVVLEASPDLGVPWFHGNYSPDNFRSIEDKSSVGRRFFAEVSGVLSSVVGSDYYAQNTMSPYFHRLDFELALVEGRPVKADVLRSLPADAKRICVILLTDSMCCTHSNKLVGAVRSSLRQLAILGYDVIKIYRSEWITGHDTALFKENILRQRIFGTGHFPNAVPVQ